MDDSAIICDVVTKSHNEKIKTIPTNFNEKKVTCKTQNVTCVFINYCSIIVSIYCYMIKYQT